MSKERRILRRARPRFAKTRKSIPKITCFNEYDAVVRQTDERKNRVVSLLGLVGEVGDVHSMMKKLILQKDNRKFRDEMREELGDLLWYLTSLSLNFGIPLQEVADWNARKALELYASGEVAYDDRAYPRDEQIPRRFSVEFIEKPLSRGVHVKVSVNDVVVGDALTDNANEDDGYRFHDVFHLAYAAVLGWSPVTRALLKCKRKSNEKVDEVEDGARAIIVEESVSLFIFNQREERGYYREKNNIDIALLKIVKKLTSNLEVSTRTAKQWQSAIVQGYAAFEQLKENRGGTVEVNLDEQKIVYISHPPKER